MSSRDMGPSSPRLSCTSSKPWVGVVDNACAEDTPPPDLGPFIPGAPIDLSLCVLGTMAAIYTLSAWKRSSRIIKTVGPPTLAKDGFVALCGGACVAISPETRTGCYVIRRITKVVGIKPSSVAQTEERKVEVGLDRRLHVKENAFQTGPTTMSGSSLTS